MADQTVQIEESVASTSLRMAESLWLKKHGKPATVDDQDFIKLVCTCAIALKGRGAKYDW